MPDDGTNVVTLRPNGSNPDGPKRKKRKVRTIDGPKSGPRAITAEQRTARAIKLRLRNYPLQKIADELGYADASGAWYAIMRGLQAELPEAQRDQLRRLEIAKLNDLESSHWEGATGFILGEDENGKTIRAYPDKDSSAIVLKCIAQRARLLGLDAPQQVTLSTRDGEAVQIEISHVLAPDRMAALEAVRGALVAESLQRSGDAIDATPSV